MSISQLPRWHSKRVDVTKPYCGTKQDLVRQFQDANEAYTKAIGALVGNVPPAEYAESQKNAEAARKLTEEVRKQLDLHTGTHGC